MSGFNLLFCSFYFSVFMFGFVITNDLVLWLEVYSIANHLYLCFWLLFFWVYFFGFCFCFCQPQIWGGFACFAFLAGMNKAVMVASVGVTTHHKVCFEV